MGQTLGDQKSFLRRKVFFLEPVFCQISSEQIANCYYRHLMWPTPQISTLGLRWTLSNLPVMKQFWERICISSDKNNEKFIASVRDFAISANPSCLPNVCLTPRITRNTGHNLLCVCTDSGVLCAWWYKIGRFESFQAHQHSFFRILFADRRNPRFFEFTAAYGVSVE